jgi:transcription-repair coupling factor (superfamily II helicase)
LPAENNEKYFQSETFGRVLGYVQAHSKTSRLKESKDKLIVIFENVKTIKAARAIFAELQEKR